MKVRVVSPSARHSRRFLFAIIENNHENSDFYLFFFKKCKTKQEGRREKWVEEEVMCLFSIPSSYRTMRNMKSSIYSAASIMDFNPRFLRG